MKCQFCKSGSTKVVDKRNVEEAGVIRRRRECLNCKRRFTTYEKFDMTDLMVRKRGGRAEAYSSEKVRNGIMRACEKRPINVHQIDSIVEEIENEIRRENLTEIESDKIGQIALNFLKKLDKIASIRFASVYKSFQNVSEFEEEIKNLLQDN